jgi:methionyl-tRNA formyltransferase
VNVAVITLDGSAYGLRVLNALLRGGRPAERVVVVRDTPRRKVRLLKRVARQVGWRDAALLAIERQLDTMRERRDRDWRGAPLVTDYAALAGEVVHASSLRIPVLAEQLAGVDLVLLGQSGIVPASLLALPAIGTLNAHPGLLPTYRGLDCPLWAVAKEDFAHVGSTLHLVDPGIDTGPILLRRAYEWRGDETAKTLEHRVYEDCIDLLVHGVELGESSAFDGEVQGEGSYYGILPRRLRRTVEDNLRAYLTA